MTRSIGARAGMVSGTAVAVLALTVAAIGVVTSVVDVGSAGAAGPANACKVLKQSEVQRAFGGTVGSGKKGFSTPASAQCEYSVAANGDRPDGTVIVHLTTTGAKAAYAALKKTSRYVPLDGVPNS